MSINLIKYGQISNSRIEKLVNSNHKSEAVKLNFFDRFKDLFKSADDKKINKLNKLYTELHSNPSLNGKGKKSNIDKIIIFNDIKKLADDESKNNFSMDIINTGSSGIAKTLKFSINDLDVLKINSAPMDKYLLERLKNDPDISNDNLLKMAKLTNASLTNNSIKIEKEHQNTVSKFCYSRTAINSNPYIIKRDYQNSELTTDEIDLYDKQLEHSFENSASIGEYIKSAPDKIGRAHV